MASGSFVLTKTGGTSSYITFTCNWSSKSNGSSANSSTVTVNIVASKSSSSTADTYGNYNASATVNGSTQNVGTTSFRLKPNSSITLLSKSYTVPHNTDGTKTTTISASVGGNVMWGSGSANVTLDTIPRASSVSAGEGNIGENITIYITRASSSFTHTLTYEFEEMHGSIGSGIETSKVWEIPTGIYHKLPNSNSGTGIITCRTYDGDTLIGKSTCEFTAIVANSNPIAGTLTYKDSNTSMVNITQDNQRIIRNKSNLVFTVGSATALNRATISKYEVTCAGVTKTITTAGDLDFGTINFSSNVIAELEVTDSRGNIAKKEIEVIVDDWVQPTGIIDIKRKNNFYTETYIKVDGTCSSLNGKNYLMIQYKYKKVTETDYSQYINLTDNVQSIAELDNQYQWNIVVRLADKIGETTYNLFLDRGMPIIFFDRLKNGVGINCFPNRKNGVDVNGADITNTYSTTERRIGTWKDGRPIYRVVLETGGLQGADAITIETPSNIHTIIKPIEGMMYDNVGNGYPLTYINTEVSNYNIGARYIRGQGIYIKSYGDFAITSGHVIIEYTKTTDKKGEVE